MIVPFLTRLKWEHVMKLGCYVNTILVIKNAHDFLFSYFYTYFLMRPIFIALKLLLDKTPVTN